MIINIRGTSGSGKTTIMKKIMECYPKKHEVYQVGRKQPIAYILKKDEDSRPVFIPGHYNTACGGCDTITSYDATFQLVRKYHDLGHDVLFEGLLISADQRHTLALFTDNYPLLVAHVDLPLEVCVDSVNQRRWTKNPEKPGVNPKNTASKWKGVKKCMEFFKGKGMETVAGDRDEILRVVKERLGLT